MIPSNYQLTLKQKQSITKKPAPFEKLTNELSGKGCKNVFNCVSTSDSGIPAFTIKHLIKLNGKNKNINLLSEGRSVISNSVFLPFLIEVWLGSVAIEQDHRVALPPGDDKPVTGQCQLISITFLIG